MRTIPLTQGKIVIVDDKDYADVARFKWQLLKARNGRYYAVCNAHLGYLSNPRRAIVRGMYLHRFLMRPAKGNDVDHRDHNGLNCRRLNMRICTRTQNNANAKPRKGGTSKYKGVCFHKAAQKWAAYINIAGKRIWLGLWMSEIEAAKSYDKAARKFYGEFACTNF